MQQVRYVNGVEENVSIFLYKAFIKLSSIENILAPEKHWRIICNIQVCLRLLPSLTPMLSILFPVAFRKFMFIRHIVCFAKTSSAFSLLTYNNGQPNFHESFGIHQLCTKAKHLKCSDFYFDTVSRWRLFIS